MKIIFSLSPHHNRRKRAVVHSSLELLLKMCGLIPTVFLVFTFSAAEDTAFNSEVHTSLIMPTWLNALNTKFQKRGGPHRTGASSIFLRKSSIPWEMRMTTNGYHAKVLHCTRNNQALRNAIRTNSAVSVQSTQWATSKVRTSGVKKLNKLCAI